MPAGMVRPMHRDPRRREVALNPDDGAIISSTQHPLPVTCFPPYVARHLLVTSWRSHLCTTNRCDRLPIRDGVTRSSVGRATLPSAPSSLGWVGRSHHQTHGTASRNHGHVNPCANTGCGRGGTATIKRHSRSRTPARRSQSDCGPASRRSGRSLPPRRCEKFSPVRQRVWSAGSDGPSPQARRLGTHHPRDTSKAQTGAASRVPRGREGWVSRSHERVPPSTSWQGPAKDESRGRGTPSVGPWCLPQCTPCS